MLKYHPKVECCPIKYNLQSIFFSIIMFFLLNILFIYSELALTVLSAWFVISSFFLVFMVKYKLDGEALIVSIYQDLTFYLNFD